jgi:N-acetylated-alpha-linked acidic dipeptidase
MRHSMISSLVLAAVFGVGAPLHAQTAQLSPAEIERQFDASLNAAEMAGWMKTMSAEPNHVGSPHNKANAEMVLAQFRDWGWDAHIETFEVLYPTPISETLELVGNEPFKATLTEAPIPGDETSARAADELPAYVAYQGDGDVSAPLVYVNYGMQEDYLQLERLGVSVRGKIVIARYGQGWRGLKPKLAQDQGAVGCIIFSDPREDGYAAEDVYPKGPARPANGVQRGSVADMTQYPGDPLTPGIGATALAERLPISEAPTILKIPVLPISYGDAQHFLAAIGGRVAPPNWRGALPITYHVGGGEGALVHMAVKSDWPLRTIYNVVAVMKGSTYPDQWIMRGNHHDGWVFGAADPMSGHIAMMGEAKAIGALAKAGWRPKRTLVYLSWDAEEPMLVGSTEWVETHAPELKEKGLVYVNTDGSGRGFLGVEGSHSLQHLVNRIAADVTDPETGVSVAARLRARMQVVGTAPGANEEARDNAKMAADAAHDLPIGALGSGSDYSAFLQHLGIAALNLGFGGEGQGGVYHSAYDTYEHYSRFGDPGFAYAPVLAKVVGRVVLRMADADVPIERYGDFAETVSRYLDQVKKLADTKREAAEAQAKMLAADAYRLTDDPTKTSGPPTALKSVPHFNMAPLENAVDHLKRSAKAYDTALAAKGATQSNATKAKLIELARQTEQRLAVDVGLPGRNWYKNLIYAPGRYTGYAPKTLPGVREAIEEERWADVDRYAALTGAALDAYADRLDEGARLMGDAGSVADFSDPPP